MRHPPVVILSEAKDLARWVEMLRYTQHDRAAVLCCLLWKDVINMRSDITSE